MTQDFTASVWSEVDFKLYFKSKTDNTERRYRAFKMSLPHEQKTRVRKVQDIFEIK